MNPADKNQSISLDHSFSVFSLGLTLGALGALMLGTKEGRRITHEVLDTISESGIFEKVARETEKTVTQATTQFRDEIGRYSDLTESRRSGAAGPPRLPPI